VTEYGYCREEQEQACLLDFEARLLTVWTAYRRVIVDAALPWAASVRHEIDERVRDLAQRVNLGVG
jgi:hypothetical protein